MDLIASISQLVQLVVGPSIALIGLFLMYLAIMGRTPGFMGTRQAAAKQALEDWGNRMKVLGGGLLVLVLGLWMTEFSFGVVTNTGNPFDDAQQAMTNEDWESAIAIYTKLLKTKPGDGNALFMRALCYKNNGEVDKALEECEKMLGKAGTPYLGYIAGTAYMGAHYIKAMVYYERQDFQAAIDEASVALGKGNHYLPQRERSLCYRMRSQAYLEIEQPDPYRAEVDLTSAIKTADSSNESLADWFATRAQVRLSLGKYDEALADYKAAIDRDWEGDSRLLEKMESKSGGEMENLARRATITASQQYGTGWGAKLVADGVIRTANDLSISVPSDRHTSWAARRGDQADLTFTWSEPVTIRRIVFYGRDFPNTSQWKKYEVVLGEQSTLAAKGEFPNNAGPHTIVLDQDVLTNKLTLKLLAAHSEGQPGAAEIEIYCTP
jgi:tetratricopeptide (TPR) repeat protein